MLLRHSLSLDEEAALIERAVSDALVAGVMTRDLKRRGAAGTAQAGDWVVARLDHLLAQKRRAA
jgi:3-isopropylmalate dehydrogenase